MIATETHLLHGICLRLLRSLSPERPEALVLARWIADQPALFGPLPPAEPAGRRRPGVAAPGWLRLGDHLAARLRAMPAPQDRALDRLAAIAANLDLSGDEAGMSTGDFSEALEALLGPNAKGLSAKTITRLKADWWKDYEAWQKRDLGNRHFLYIWADGVYFKPRMAEEKQCVLVIVGADEYGRKELLAMTDGFRESTQSWRELLLDLKRRGLKQDPKLAIGDGALGFWTALREVFASTREQRCWVHKTMNVLNALPKSIQAKAKGHLHDIWQAETKSKANAAFDFFVATYGVKWDKAVARLVKDRDALLTCLTTIRRNTGSTSARQTRLRAHSPPSDIEQSAPRDASAAKPGWPWPSS